ncbi:formimidoylglutamate deiminase [Granulosicoccus antarcticus]|uniref:8-oxoguanine deaminase n=1 Tax=Granulosicoccus antarcticus IMCC3135 TaxID=1192854 RepID=A0A2Z2P1J2_9GAMM|nr:formimidoylglutamate deiminase [Granulosicoccus antarcticus]ASJ74317.1 8-oxoguanine deaminase [Granulosicoccus antarcticus IMCC3135]
MKIIHAAQALLPDGWVSDVLVDMADDGRIASVQRCSELPDWDSSQASWKVDVLLPAPANLHGHAFQRAMAGLSERRGPDPRDSFWSWRNLMYRFLDQLQPDDMEAISAFVQMEMLEAGYATNVEFHYVHHQSGGHEYDNPAELAVRIAAATQTSGIGLTLLPVHYQYGGCDQRALNEAQRRFGTDLTGYARLWSHAQQAISHLPADSLIGVAPHSLRAVARESLPELLAMAPSAPFHMHIAEQVAEVEEVQNAWGARPIEWLLDNANVDSRWCLIHCTQMLAHETAGLARTGAVAGLCPITESSLGDGIFDGVSYLEQQGLIGIGSDSNIRISLSEELRTLDYSQRLRDRSRAALATSEYSTGRRMFDEVVRGGAQAAGRQSGRIEAGQWADFLTLDGQHPDLEGVTGDALLDIFIFAGDDNMVRDVWSAGRHQVASGRHINRDTIVQKYRKVMKKLRGS